MILNLELFAGSPFSNKCITACHVDSVIGISQAILSAMFPVRLLAGSAACFTPVASRSVVATA
jgi:hypothetical protein